MNEYFVQVSVSSLCTVTVFAENEDEAIALAESASSADMEIDDTHAEVNYVEFVCEHEEEEE